MRPLRLEMQAFGPYADVQTLDFRELRDNSFFLITGPTGAGKTSVLDAMCYALYGETTGAERTAAQMRSDFADEATSTRVVFDFALGDAAYRVERSPEQERPSKRGGGTTRETAAATLWRLDEAGATREVLATKATAVTKKAEELLGFSVDQFRQVVMLPQGRFRDLLSSKSEERQEILEQLFGAGVYRRVELALKDEAGRLYGSLKDLTAKSAGVRTAVGVADDAELADRLAGAAALESQAKAAAADGQKAADKARAALEVGRETARLVGEVARTADAADKAQTALGEAKEAATAAADAVRAQKARGPESDALKARLREHEQALQRLGGYRSACESCDLARDAVQKADEALADATIAAGAADADAATARETLEATRSAVAGLGAREEELKALQAQVEATAALEAARKAQAEAGTDLARAAKATAAAETALADALARHLALDAAWRAGRATALAEGLVDGEPCPVCGSTHHPAPAHEDVAVPSDEAVAEAFKEVERARETLRTAERAKADAQTREAAATEAAAAHAAHAGDPAARERASALAGEVDALKARAASVLALETALAEAEKGRATAATALETARAAAAGAREALATAEATRTEREAALPAEARDVEAIERAKAEAAELLEAMAVALETAGQADAEARERLAAATEAERLARDAAAAAAKAAKGLGTPDVPALEAAAEAAAEAGRQLDRAHATALADVKRYRDAQETLRELSAQHGEAEDRWRTLQLLADTATGNNPAKVSFQRYVLGVFLDEVLVAASRRLLDMTRGRYRMYTSREAAGRVRKAGLDLEVFDEFTGETRPAGTLSGGEGFMASLALALGLAEVVQAFAGGIRLDTVFVDEGFGTLDPESLDAAVDTLLSLREHGRLVGVISHVPELRERIDCRLVVSAGRRGSTARFEVP